MQRLTLLLLLLPLAAYGQQYPGGGGPYPTKAFSGTNINNGSIPLSKLSQSSAVSGQVAEWNGSSWVASDVQGVTIPNTISSNAPVLNTTYTNTSGSIQLVEGAFSLTTTGVVGQASADIYIDQAGGTAFVRHPISAVTSLITSIAQSYTNTFSIAVSNNATWFLTNSSAGTGDSAALVAGSSQLVTLADGAVAGVATLAGANVFTASNYFVVPIAGNTVNVTNITVYDSITIQTNLTVNQNTTLNTVNVSGKATFNQFLVVSNGIQYASTAWTGPTNTIDLNIGRQHYSTVTPISITGFIHKSATNAQPVVLKGVNTSGTNITLYLPANFIDLNYGTTYTVTNGWILSLEYDPFLTLTNGLARVW